MSIAKRQVAGVDFSEYAIEKLSSVEIEQLSKLAKADVGFQFSWHSHSSISYVECISVTVHVRTPDNRLFISSRVTHELLRNGRNEWSCMVDTAEGMWIDVAQFAWFFHSKALLNCNHQ